MVTGGPGQKPDRKKMTWSGRQRYGHWWVKNDLKCIASLSIQSLLFCFWFESAPGFASCGVCADANLIVITPKEQTGAESIVYSGGTVTRSSSFTKPGFKNQTVLETTITSQNSLK